MLGTNDRDPVCNFVIMGRSWGGVVKQNVNREKQIFCLGHKRSRHLQREINRPTLHTIHKFTYHWGPFISNIIILKKEIGNTLNVP